MKFSTIRVGGKLSLFLVMVGALLGPYALLLMTMPKKRYVVAQLFFKGCLALTGLRLHVRGTLAPNTQLFVANHSSYLDIPILGALIGNGVFVAKSEVADWPLFGFLARISRTLFISRSGYDAAQQCALLTHHMNKGSGLILFPEGTSTDGSHVKRFKSTLFASLDNINGDAWVQPISIVYTRDKTGKALSQTARQRFTWFGDMTLAPHLFQVFAMNGCEVEVMFHKPLFSNDYTDRKQLAKASEHIISKHVMETIARTENTIPPEKGVDDLHVESAPMVRTP